MEKSIDNSILSVTGTDTRQSEMAQNVLFMCSTIEAKIYGCPPHKSKSLPQAVFLNQL